MRALQSISLIRLALIALFVVTPTSGFAQLNKAGVVTTLQGTATVSRASLSQPVPLKFKDDVFVQDRVATGDDSVARILLGGRAIVTVRERSTLTISEAPGVSTVNVGLGRAAIAVAKERMKPGETIEIKTPNAIAGIRGTIVVVEVDQTTAQAGPGAAAFTTRFTVLAGEVLVRQLQGGQPFGSGVTLNRYEQARFTGLTPPVTRSLTPSEAGQLSNSFKATKTDPPAAVNAPLVTQSQAAAIQTVTTVTPTVASSPVSTAVTNSIQASTNTATISDKLQDNTVTQATVSSSQTGAEATQAAAATVQLNQLLNSLPASVKADLTSTLTGGSSGSSGSGSSGSSNSGSGSSGSGISGSSNSGSGSSGSVSSGSGKSGSGGSSSTSGSVSSGSGSGGSGTTTVTLPNGQTVQVILKDGKLKVDNSGKGGSGKH